MYDLKISGAEVLIEGNEETILADILVKDGKIAAIGSDLPDAKNTVEAKGLLALPGAIDSHVHFNDPGFETQEDFFQGTSAAASGGVTTIIDMPCTSLPPVTSLNNLENKLSIVSPKAIIDFAFHGGVSHLSMTEGFPLNMKEIAPYVAAYKTYTLSGMETFPKVSYDELDEVLKTAKELDRIVMVHAEDEDVCNQAKVNKESNSPKEFSQSRPEEAEITAVKKVVSLAKKYQTDLHIVHIGTAKAASFLDEPYLSGETCPHYLAFTLDDFEKIGAPLKICPPIKPNHNKEELWQLVQNGKISFITSDHAPCPKERKQCSIWQAYGGIPGVGTLFPYMFSEGYLKGKISLKKLSEITSLNTAKKFKLDDRKGSIKVGKDADIVLINAADEWLIKGDDFLSKGKVTPFENMIFKGKIYQTFVRGSKVYDHKDGICVARGYGNFQKPRA
ncbi:MAG: allantoinase AllB [Alphaproteobacteria bacterium]